MPDRKPVPQSRESHRRPAAGASLCQHTLIELHGCDPRRLERTREVRTSMIEAVRAGHGTIVKALFHNFSPYGVSGVVVITESHVTVHTWPEHGYAAVDVFSCSGAVDHRAIRQALAGAFGARRTSSRTLRRGIVR